MVEKALGLAKPVPAAEPRRGRHHEDNRAARHMPHAKTFKCVAYTLCCLSYCVLLDWPVSQVRARFLVTEESNQLFLERLAEPCLLRSAAIE